MSREDKISSREREIAGQIKKLDCELSHVKRVKSDWEWLNENRQSLFERYATGTNAAIAFCEKDVFSVGVFTSDGVRSDCAAVRWDFNQNQRVGPTAPDGYQIIDIIDLLRRKTDSLNKVLTEYNHLTKKVPEWVDKD